ncbi:cation:proton antiporter [Mucilaginibacter boryungensis]|uniref:Sodium:proton antiporter n=1 Tax=Mucilaginibacter boryungensis TaxID=768480 RepID=A0ABR9XGX5_9SPHI|nr:sodium:proton antiporter [Mucilaginibacter boryungensis]MBE9666310.1 sodium:proton antiporter [Mucilaginibacter boryungensis]
MDLFFIIALLIIISATYSYINARFIKLPGTIGIISLAIGVSIIVLIINSVNPKAAKYLTVLAKNIDFSRTVLNIMLGFLLFAGSFNLNVKRLKKEMRPVLVLSTIGVILSTGIFGVLFYFIAPLFHIYVPLIYCLLFGALVSPTDPVAVGAIIKNSRLPAHLETIISGESLFNDGVGLVLFITLLEITESGIQDIDFANAAVLFVREVFGGIILGVVFGFLAFRLMRSIKDFQTIVLVSLSLVMAISLIANYLHLSIPLAVVSAGLFAGNRSINLDDNEHSHQALERFWQLVDELLNTILFVMIGLQMVNFPFLNNYWMTGSLAIILILMARWASVTIPLTFLKRTLNVNYSSVKILTWAGLRGGISIALALSLPHTKYRELILAGSYFIVIFSIIVQGLTLNRVINAAYKSEHPEPSKP